MEYISQQQCWYSINGNLPVQIQVQVAKMICFFLESMLAVMQIYGVKALVKSYLPEKSIDVRQQINEVFDILSGIILEEGIFKSIAIRWPPLSPFKTFLSYLWYRMIGS